MARFSIDVVVNNSEQNARMVSSSSQSHIYFKPHNRKNPYWNYDIEKKKNSKKIDYFYVTRLTVKDSESGASDVSILLRRGVSIRPRTVFIL